MRPGAVRAGWRATLARLRVLTTALSEARGSVFGVHRRYLRK